MPRLRTSVFSAVLAIIFLIVAGTAVFHYLEDWTVIQSFYFSVTTLTTVGYGDLVPSNDTTRLVTSLFILIGVGIVLAALTSIGTRYLSSQEHQLSDNLTRRLLRNLMRRNSKTKKRKR